MMKLLNNDISYNLSFIAGGIEVHSVPNVQIVGNTMISNTAGFNAGGIWLSDSAGLFQRNLLIGNRVTNAGMAGGGARVSLTSTLKMDGNWFEETARLSAAAACRSKRGRGRPQRQHDCVEHVEFWGGVYLASQGALTVTNNIIARNTAALGGAGVYVQDTLPLIIGNNTIASNNGTGITFNAAGGIQIYNNIVRSNTAGGLVRLDGSSYFADYNDVASNSPNYSGVATGPHDLSVDPLFIGSGAMFNYYHIQPTSPVSKTGLLISPPLYDIDGERRLLCMSMGADQICTKNLLLPLILK
jgi:parallel beta-helix repeat protein